MRKLSIVLLCAAFTGNTAYAQDLAYAPVISDDLIPDAEVEAFIAEYFPSDELEWELLDDEQLTRFCRINFFLKESLKSSYLLCA